MEKKNNNNIIIVIHERHHHHHNVSLFAMAFAPYKNTLRLDTVKTRM